LLKVLVWNSFSSNKDYFRIFSINNIFFLKAKIYERNLSTFKKKKAIIEEIIENFPEEIFQNYFIFCKLIIPNQFIEKILIYCSLVNI
jgi:hypothetical protein